VQKQWRPPVRFAAAVASVQARRMQVVVVVVVVVDSELEVDRVLVKWCCRRPFDRVWGCRSVRVAHRPPADKCRDTRWLAPDCIDGVRRQRLDARCSRDAADCFV